MKLQNQIVLLTGASGGIGRALAQALAARGARLLINARDLEKLNALAGELRRNGARVTVLPADLGSQHGIEQLAHAASSGGAPDIVVHCAGAMAFGAIENQDPALIERLWRTNVIAPSLLTRALLPAMRRRGSGRLVFVGSIFGSLGFPMYASYSASKFALRGFAEALRRELDGSGIAVSYMAPRYTRTDLNAGAPQRLAAALGMRQDAPEDVARRIVAALEHERRDLYFGFAERLFVWLNALFPALVDRGLRAQTQRMRELEPLARPGPSIP